MLTILAMNKFKEYIHLYGLWNALSRVLKAVLWKVVHFTWDKAYLKSRSKQEEIPLLEPVDFTIRRLKREDLFEDANWEVYIGECANLLLRCFDSDYAQSYGAFVDGRLAYVTWILYDHLEIDGEHRFFKDCAMQWKAFCLSEFRGRGLHDYVKAWAVNEMLRNGVKKCYAVTLAYNRPALKAQNKCGYVIERTFYMFKLGKRMFYRWSN